VYPISEDHNITTTAQASITQFLGSGGTLANSANPAGDVAQFVSYLNGLGFTTAGKSVQATYTLIAQHAAKNMATAAGASTGVNLPNAGAQAGDLLNQDANADAGTGGI
jgi:hypothetical protein